MSQSASTNVGIARARNAYGASGGLTNDIQLNRGDELLIRNREVADQKDTIIDQAATIKNLQAHSKSKFEY